MDEMGIVRSLINRLNDEQVNYCHWKSNQHVADVFSGVDDIDMLIDQEDVLKLNIILNDLGYKRFRLPEKRAYIGIEDYLGFDSDKGSFVHLHLHYQLTLGEKFLKGYQLPYSRSIMNRRIFDEHNKIFITSHEDEMWLLILRAALKLRHRDFIKQALNKDVFGSSTRKEFEWLQQKMDIILFEQITNDLFGEKVANKMIAIVTTDLNFTVIKSLDKLVEKVCKPFKAYTVAGGTLSRWSRESFRVRQVFHNRLYKGAKSYRRTPVTGGKMIAFLGPDGAGKSTVLKEVNKRLEKMMDVHQIYLGSGDGQTSLLRKPLKIVYGLLLKKGILDRKSRKVDETGKVYRVGEQSKAGIIRKIGQLPWTVTLAKERKNKLLKARKFKNKGYVVLTDRYPQTQVADMCDGPRYYLNDTPPEQPALNKLLAKVEKNSFSVAETVKPDAIIILKVSSEVAYQRKPDEIDIPAHKNLMKTILDLNYGETTKRIVVDADQPLEKVIVDVLTAIWGCL